QSAGAVGTSRLVGMDERDVFVRIEPQLSERQTRQLIRRAARFAGTDFFTLKVRRSVYGRGDQENGVVIAGIADDDIRRPGRRVVLDYMIGADNQNIGFALFHAGKQVVVCTRVGSRKLKITSIAG